MIDFTSGGSEQLLYNPNSTVSEEVLNFGGANDSGALSLEIVDFAKGGSQELQFNPSSVTSEEILDYNGANATGGLKDATYDWTAGGSQEVISNPQSGVSEEIANFSGANGSGELTTATFDETNGNTLDYSFDYNGSGSETEYVADLYNPSGSLVAWDQYNANGSSIANDGSIGTNIIDDGQTTTSTQNPCTGGHEETEAVYDEDGNYVGDEEVWVDDPVILNLAGNKVQTTALANSTTYFDMQNSGQAVQTGWATAGEGFLIDDPSGSFAVTQASDLISGFSALAAFDSNHDGKLNATDAAWNDLRVWVDQSGNGQFQAGSLYTLNQLGIASIDLNGTVVNQNNNGNIIVDDSTFTWSNGTTGDIAGVNLVANPNNVLGETASSVPGADTLNGNASLGLLIQAMATFQAEAAAATTVSLSAAAAAAATIAVSQQQH